MEDQLQLRSTFFQAWGVMLSKLLVLLTFTDVSIQYIRSYEISGNDGRHLRKGGGGGGRFPKSSESERE